MPPINKDHSPKVNPAFGIIVSLGLLAVSALILWLPVEGFRKGEVWKFSKHQPSLVVRADFPAGFWGQEAFYLFFGLMFSALAIWLLVNAIREMIRR
jgi:hypothetical protein